MIRSLFIRSQQIARGEEVPAFKSIALDAITEVARGRSLDSVIRSIPKTV